MSSYKNILFAVDFVEKDDNPISRKVVEISGNHQAMLSLIHVIEIPISYGEAYEATAIADWQSELNQEANGRLEKMGQKLQVPKERQFIRMGGTRSGILDVAEEISADLIVVGSHGRHGLGLIFLGSTATAVINGAHCDVLAVRV